MDKLIEARHGLLDELFNKFAGPIDDLAKSVQSKYIFSAVLYHHNSSLLVINNIRKIPYMSNAQLRLSILHYRKF